MKMLYYHYCVSDVAFIIPYIIHALATIIWNHILALCTYSSDFTIVSTTFFFAFYYFLILIVHFRITRLLRDEAKKVLYQSSWWIRVIVNFNFNFIFFLFLTRQKSRRKRFNDSQPTFTFFSYIFTFSSFVFVVKIPI